MKIRIGIFDSGLGGLAVYKEIKKRIPQIETFYYSDHAYCPYGPRPLEEVLERCTFITEKLSSYRVQMIVVACNTATTLAITHLRETFPQTTFVGIEPFIKYVCHETYQKERNFHPALLLTLGTAMSERFKKLRQEFDPGEQLKVYPLPTLATFIEENIHLKNTPSFRQELETLLSPLKNQGHDCAVLGCTHYPLIASEIESILGLKTISPEPFVAQRVVTLLQEQKFISDDLNNANNNDNYLDNFHFESSGEVPYLKEKLTTILQEFKKN